jgi:hypothetical protein
MIGVRKTKETTGVSRECRTGDPKSKQHSTIYKADEILALRYPGIVFKHKTNVTAAGAPIITQD